MVTWGGTEGGHGMSPALRSIDRTPIRCLVCGASEVRTDEVHDLGWVFLAE